MTNICLLLSKYEKDVDLEVFIPSALLQDIGRAEESEDKRCLKAYATY
ncbi:hypothetical protein [Clostridium estertheticum]|nr:hypothetical protein [Clostridium estertheticum]